MYKQNTCGGGYWTFSIMLLIQIHFQVIFFSLLKLIRQETMNEPVWVFFFAFWISIWWKLKGFLFNGHEMTSLLFLISIFTNTFNKFNQLYIKLLPSVSSNSLLFEYLIQVVQLQITLMEVWNPYFHATSWKLNPSYTGMFISNILTSSDETNLN